MGRAKRGGYLFEWWIGDHPPKHVHVYKNGREIAKVEIPNLLVLKGKVNKALIKAIGELIKEGKL
ncbi:MAG: hypothetical protein A3F16_06165 [Deltaproteobacteria bacterium RIFCSPHIGHO2_12_FULL_43_9]|nr:MAG: hypothetical protein A3F16_06165 [Deltaproteobacteria bacterium RIFCSPHIGHO2_12_FULL_43_9]